MADSFHISDFTKPIYLHHSLEKFWEIKLDPMTHKAIIRCGKLESTGREDPQSVQALEKANASWGEAVLYAEKHIKMKLGKGYEFMEKSTRSATNVSYSLAPPAKDTLDLLSDGARSSIGLSPGSPNGKKRPSDVLLREDLKQPKKDNGKLADEDEDLMESIRRINERERIEAIEKDLGEFTQKAYKMESLKDSEKSVIADKAQSLELICDFVGTKISVTGYQKKIDLFVDYLKKFIAQKKKAEESNKKEIVLTPEMVKNGALIEEKGLGLGLICEVHEKSVIVLGEPDKIVQLEMFIREKEKDLLKPQPKPVEDKSVKKEIALTTTMKGRKAEIEKKADQLEVFSEFTDTKLIMLGSHAAIAELFGYLLELDAVKEAKDSKDSKDSKEKSDKDMGDYTQKELKLSKAITNNMPEVKKKAEALELILDVEGDKFLVAGFEKNIKELQKFIEEKEKEKPKEDSSRAVALKAAAGSGDYVQKEISISTFHRGRQEEIEKKAEEMGLICDFGYDVVLISGQMSAIGMFIAYLYEVESEAKKALYPKYWDFHEVNAFSMANIPSTSAEFKEIERLFLQTMHGHKILRLERIQNKYLMDHYVTNIQKRLELRPKDLNRMLLFHGTRATAPETIYKNFDTGFDLQYANHGAYGKGLYFAVGANYSHGGFVYRTPRTGTFQLIVADVFVGKSKNSGGGNFIKAPEGYDSISANGGFYIIYNNFHSYPLYLMEYK